MLKEQTADATHEQPVKWRNEDKRELNKEDEKKMSAADLENYVK